MKSNFILIYPLTVLLLVIIFSSHLANGQNSLEFQLGTGNPANNPTGNGPTLSNQVITFRENTNNPGGSTFSNFTPARRVTFSISNQQYPLPASESSTLGSIVFGGDLDGSNKSMNSNPLFETLSSHGDPSSSYFSALPNSGAGTGISIGTNRGVWIFSSVRGLYNANRSTTGRYYMADLTVTFNTAVTNPVLHLNAVGGKYTSSTTFSTELELENPSGITFTKLSGSSELTLDATKTKILNGASTPNSEAGQGAMAGSLRVNGTFTTLTFKVYIRGKTSSNGSSWGSSDSHHGDNWMIAFSQAACLASGTTPTLNTSALTGSCTSTSFNLGLITSDAPAGTQLTWHSSTPATAANKIANISAVPAGTYYASFYDPFGDCYGWTRSFTTGSISISSTATHPTCNAPGTIVINASGAAILEYSLDGITWKSTNTFTSLAPGTYTPRARYKDSPECVVSGSPVTLNTAVATTIPSLEFAAGAGNPTWTGPSTANQVITLQNNADNPSGNSFGTFTPTRQVTFALASVSPYASAASFGASGNTSGTTAEAASFFPNMDIISEPTDAMFQSSAYASGGISVSNNKAVRIFNSTRSLRLANSSTAARHLTSTLTITFNAPVTNPVLHLVGLGGVNNPSSGVSRYSAELELQTAGISLSKLSGSSELTISGGTKILNNSNTPGGQSGWGAASGSVLVTGTNITTVTFNICERRQRQPRRMAGNQ